MDLAVGPPNEPNAAPIRSIANKNNNRAPKMEATLFIGLTLSAEMECFNGCSQEFLAREVSR